MLELALLVAPVFVLIAIGYGVAATRLVGEAASKGLAEFLFVVATPALIFKLIAASGLPPAIPWGYWIAYYLGMAVVWALAMAAARLVFRLSHGEAVIAGLSTGQANTVLIGIPVILKAYGEAAGYPIALLLAVNLPITMTAATLLLEGGRAQSGGHVAATLVKGLATHPILIAIAAGVLCHIAGVRPSGVAAAVVDMLAASAVPLALVSVGTSLKADGARADLPVAAVASALRLVVHPAIAYGVAHHGFGLPPVYVGAVVLFAAMPAGVNAYLFAARYGQGVGIASTTIALSTAASAATTVFWLWALGAGAH